MAQLFTGTFGYIALDANGTPIAGAKVYTYQAGTLTPKAVFADAAGTVETTFPVVCDANGRARFFLGSGGYRFRATMPDGTTLIPDGDTDGVETGETAAEPVIYANDWAGVDPTGVSECGAALRQAMAQAAANGYTMVWDGIYRVSYDPVSAFNDGGTTRYSYCLKFPTGTAHIFNHGSIIRAATGLQAWTRVVSLEGGTGYRITGRMEVDGNVSGVGATTNEHMHGLFLFDTTHSYIEEVFAHDTRGDGVFIGGTDEVVYSNHIRIGHVRTERNGRKGLVLQHFDNVHIGSVFLDNSAGGATLFAGTPDDTDKHSLDVEPDAYTGAQPMRAYIGKAYTKGTGNDFTAGTGIVGQKVCITFGSFVHDHTASATVQAWTQYACTVVADDIQIRGLSGIAATVTLQYSAKLIVGRMLLDGSTPAVDDPLFLLAANGTNRPDADIGSLEVVNTVGAGVEARDSRISVESFKPQTAGLAAWARGTSSSSGITADVNFLTVDMTDVGTPAGASSALLISKAGSQQPYLNIGRLRFRDTRGTKLNQVVRVDSGGAAGVSIGVTDNDSGVLDVTWVGADKFYRAAGGIRGLYVCEGSPEGVVAAGIGSQAMRLDGGAGTSLYVKQSGTGSAGWVGK